MLGHLLTLRRPKSSECSTLVPSLASSENWAQSTRNTGSTRRAQRQREREEHEEHGNNGYKKEINCGNIPRFISLSLTSAAMR